MKKAQIRMMFKLYRQIISPETTSKLSQKTAQKLIEDVIENVNLPLNSCGLSTWELSSPVLLTTG